jgi:aryl-alcohol dehydrogenase-like predicted oxidoreductase
MAKILEGLRVVEGTAFVAAPLAGMTLAQMALRWILDYDAIGVVIPGASKPGQISETVKASSLKPLDTDFHDWLADFYAERVSTNIRGPY